MLRGKNVDRWRGLRALGVFYGGYTLEVCMGMGIPMGIPWEWE